MTRFEWLEVEKHPYADYSITRGPLTHHKRSKTDYGHLIAFAQDLSDPCYQCVYRTPCGRPRDVGTSET
jgi:hypothetical protein